MPPIRSFIEYMGSRWHRGSRKKLRITPVARSEVNLTDWCNYRFLVVFHLFLLVFFILRNWLRSPPAKLLIWEYPTIFRHTFEHNCEQKMTSTHDSLFHGIFKLRSIEWHWDLRMKRIVRSSRSGMKAKFFKGLTVKESYLWSWWRCLLSGKIKPIRSHLRWMKRSVQHWLWERRRLIL